MSADTPTEPTKPKTGEHPVTNGELRRELRWNDLRVIGGTAVALFVAGWAAFFAMTARADSEVEKGVAPIRQQVESTNKRLDEHIRDSGSARAQQDRTQQRTEAKVDRIDAMMLEVRELAYRDRGMRAPPPPALNLPDGGT